MRVLIIDDHEEFRQLLRLHVAHEWPKADIQEIDPRTDDVSKERLEELNADVVLLDHQMGQHNGMELLAVIKQTSPKTVVVFLTAFGDERLAVKAIKNGADDYLPKANVTGPQLISTIRESLRSRMGPPTGRTLPNTLLQGGGSAAGIEIRGYNVISKIASGASSAVYLAHSQSRGEDVVLKVLFGSFEQSDEHEVFERFLIEYQSVSAIKHPNIVNIFDVGVADDHVFISMEYLPGGSLKTYLHEQGKLEPKRALEILVKVTEAVAAIHDVGTLHRDLKPGNVMFRTNGDLCIIDFGLAKQVQIEQDITQPGKIYGTPYYMSPEQAQGLDIDGRSDIYSLGIMLFELLTGLKPYSAGTPVALIYKHAHANIPQLPENIKKYQFSVDTLMAKDPNDRPATLEQVLQVLKQCQTL